MCFHKCCKCSHDFLENEISSLSTMYIYVLYMIHSYVHKPTVQSVASVSLFLDIQEVALLLGEYTLFACTNSYYPTTRLRSYFSTIFVEHLLAHVMGYKRSFK